VLPNVRHFARAFITDFSNNFDSFFVELSPQNTDEGAAEALLHGPVRFADTGLLVLAFLLESG